MAGEIQRALRCQGGARNDGQSRRDKADTEGCGAGGALVEGSQPAVLLQGKDIDDQEG